MDIAHIRLNDVSVIAGVRPQRIASMLIKFNASCYRSPSLICANAQSAGASKKVNYVDLVIWHPTSVELLV